MSDIRRHMYDTSDICGQTSDGRCLIDIDRPMCNLYCETYAIRHLMSSLRSDIGCQTSDIITSDV